MANFPMKEVVSVSQAWNYEVALDRDFANQTRNLEKLASYVPNSASKRAMVGICEGVYPPSKKRAHLITGTYGTGKSHFALILADFLSRELTDSGMKPFLDKLSADREVHGKVVHLRDGVKRFLVVTPSTAGDPQGFNHALLIALRDALEREHVDFQPRSQFHEAVEVINYWKEQDREAFKKLEAALDKRGSGADILCERLGKFEREAYTQFLEVYPVVTHGSRFSPEYGADPTRIYAEAAKCLRGTGEWEGIFVIFDEFGKYLSQMASDPYGFEGSSMQAFAEYCKRSDQEQVHFVAVSHVSFQDYARGKIAQEDFEKIHGRFLESEYLISAGSDKHEMEEMIDSIIVQHHSGSRWEEVCRHPDMGVLVDSAMDSDLYSGKGRDWVENTVVKGGYPLHLHAMFCLPWLADRVGQATRSLFRFFASEEEGGLTNFVNTNDALDESGRLNLFTLDQLAVYFDTAIRASSDHKQVAVAMDEALGACGGLELAPRVVRAVAILAIVEDPKLRPSYETLAEALRLSPSDKVQLKQLLDELVDRGVLRYRGALDEYALRKAGPGVVDVPDRIEKEATRIADSVNLAEALNRRKPLLPIPASEYNQAHYTSRQAECTYVRPAQLSNPKEFLDRIRSWYEPAKQTGTSDAIVLYLLAETEGQILDAERYRLNKDCQHPQLIVALPKSPVGFRDTVVRLEAISSLMGQPPFADHSSPEYRELMEEYRDLENKLNIQVMAELKADNLAWHNAGSVSRDVGRGQVSQYVSQLMDKVFPRTPALSDRAINERGGKDTSRRDREDVLDLVLGSSGSLQIKKEGGSARDRILRNCFKNTELLEFVADKGAVQEFRLRPSPPPGSALSEVWRLVSDTLFGDRRGDKSVSAADVVVRLVRPPYGMSPQAIEMVLGACLSTASDECILFSGYREVERTGNRDRLTERQPCGARIQAMVRDPGDWWICYYEATDADREYIAGVRQLLSPGGESDEKVALWESAKRALLGWFNDLPTITRCASTLDNMESRALALLLSSDEETADTKRLLKGLVPERLEVKEQDEKRRYREVIDKLRLAYEELANFAPKIENMLVGRACKVFEAKGQSLRDLADAVQAWYNSLPESTRLHVFADERQHLLDVAKAEGPIAQRMIIDLPERMGFGQYLDWTQDKSEEFMLKLQLTKLEIERWQPTEPPKPAPDSAHDDRAKLVAEAAMEIKGILDTRGLSIEQRREVLNLLLREFDR